MNRARFGLQSLIVIVLIMLVSWPEFRPVGAVSVWRYDVEAAARAMQEDIAQYISDDRVETRGRGRRFSLNDDELERARRVRGGTTADDAGRTNFVASSALAAFGAKTNVITGRARTSLNTPIPFAKVLLRNIRTGQIEARATANEEGRFQFLDLDSSSYIVELIGADGGVVASSEMVGVGTGDIRETTVRVSVSAAALATAFGTRSASPTLDPRSAFGRTTGLTTGGQDITRTASPTDLRAASQ